MPTYYINADTGNNGNPGSSASPWLTLAYAITNSASGDTIILQDATAVYSTTSDITISKNLTIQGEQDDASGALIDGTTFTPNDAFNISANVTMQNVTIQNYSPSTRLFRITSGNVSLSFENVVFKNILLNTYGFFRGIAVPNSSLTGVALNFDKCLFDDIYGQPGISSTVLIAANSGTSMTVTITSCTLSARYSGTEELTDIFGLSGTYSTSTFTVKNSIFHSSRGTNLDWGTVNLNTKSTTYSCLSNIDNAPSGTGNITSDPLFADAANSDFRLQRDSPAIATGVLV